MKGAGPKIIIKPRLGRGGGVSRKSRTPVAPPPGSSEEEGEIQENENPSDTASNSPSNDAEEDDKMNVAESVAGTNDVMEGSEAEKEDEDATEAGDEGELDGVDRTTAPRPRGRPRGRGKGAAPTVPRARGRPRGSGRGRGRGRGRGGLTIKLPRRDEDGQGEGEGDGLEDIGEEGQALEAEEREIMGGGKPFKKIQGKIYIIDNDEIVTEDDPKGDTKIDVNGNLLGGRRFKAQTFSLPGRHPDRLYMLAIDAARSSGFRDSLYYFRRNLLALKLNATQPEKEYLIEAGKLGSHLRTRSVTLITARSAYKLHGAKMILEGKWIDDDYYEEKVLQEITERGLKPGDLVGDLTEPQTNTNEAATLAATMQAKVDRGGGLGIYRAGGPTTIFGGSGWGPYSDGPLNAVRKSVLNRDGLNEENWMLIAAQRTLEASEEWAKIRKETLKVCGGILAETLGKGKEKQKPDDDGNGNKTSKRAATEETEGERKKKRVRSDEDDLPMGIYEPHSGIVHYRGDTQPSRCRWEALPDSSEKRRVLGGTKAGNGAWALAWIDTVMEVSTIDESGPSAKERNEALASIDGELT